MNVPHILGLTFPDICSRHLASENRPHIRLPIPLSEDCQPHPYRRTALGCSPTAVGPRRRTSFVRCRAWPDGPALGHPSATLSRDPRIHRLPFPSCDPRACYRTRRGPGVRDVAFFSYGSPGGVPRGIRLPESYAAPVDYCAAPHLGGLPWLPQTCGSNKAFLFFLPSRGKSRAINIYIIRRPSLSDVPSSYPYLWRIHIVNTHPSHSRQLARAGTATSATTCKYLKVL